MITIAYNPNRNPNPNPNLNPKITVIYAVQLPTCFGNSVFLFIYLFI